MYQLKQLSKSRIIIALFILALVARLLVFSGLFFNFGAGSFYLANHGAPLTDNDSQNYVTIAKNIVEHGSYSRFAEGPFEPDSFRTPLLVFFFVPFIYLFGFSSIWLAMLVLNVVLSLTGVLAYFTARLFLPKGYAIAVGALVALEPLLVYRSSIAEPDALIVLLLLLAVYLFVRFWQEGRGSYFYWTAALLGVLTLAKPVGTLLIFLFILAALGRGLFYTTKSAALVRQAALGLLIFVAVLSPWLYRNYAVFGEVDVSSVSSYNFYNYYTANLAQDREVIPESFADSRDAVRSLKHRDYLLETSWQRIKSQPAVYARQHLLGTIRNLFASDFTAIYHHDHQALLPFSYSPVNSINMTELALGGNYSQLLKSAVSSENLIFLLRHIGFFLFYIIVLLAWIKSFRDKQRFFLFSFFLLLAFYFVFTTATFVDAKYRLPAVPLLLIVFFYFFSSRKGSNKSAQSL